MSDFVHFAVVKDGLVIAIRHAPPGWSDAEPNSTSIQVDPELVGVGWAYDGSTFTEPEPPPLSTDELLAAASAYQNKLLASVWTFTVEDASGNTIELTTKLDDRGQAAMSQLVIFAREADGTAMTEPYSNIDYTSAILTPTMARELGFFKAGAAKAATYVALNAVASRILASPPTITTVEQVENAADWPNPEEKA